MSFSPMLATVVLRLRPGSAMVEFRIGQRQTRDQRHLSRDALKLAARGAIRSRQPVASNADFHWTNCCHGSQWR